MVTFSLSFGRSFLKLEPIEQPLTGYLEGVWKKVN